MSTRRDGFGYLKIFEYRSTDHLSTMCQKPLLSAKLQQKYSVVWTSRRESHCGTGRAGKRRVIDCSLPGSPAVKYHRGGQLRCHSSLAVTRARLSGWDRAAEALTRMEAMSPPTCPVYTVPIDTQWGWSPGSRKASEAAPSPVIGSGLIDLQVHLPSSQRKALYLGL